MSLVIENLDVGGTLTNIPVSTVGLCKIKSWDVYLAWLVFWVDPIRFTIAFAVILDFPLDSGVLPG